MTGDRTDLTITIVYDNKAFVEDLVPDWGFSCLVDARGRRILFDTGAKGHILLGNLEKLGISPSSIDEIFISHDHWDHTGGLSALMEIHPVRVYAPAPLAGTFGEREMVRISSPARIHEGIHSTGLLAGIEQSLVVETDQGLVVIAGCSHPGVGAILVAASTLGRPFALIGGLHGFSDLDRLAGLRLVCPTHCTRLIAEIASRHPDKYTPGGAGRVISFSAGR